MKKFSILITGLLFAIPLAASAATFNVSPSSGSYNTGDTVTLNVSVNPAGSTIYTAMLDARFSPANFEVVSFTLNDALLPLKQSGYDALDNTNGILTKTGGYTGGLSSTASFGTVVLKAKNTGSATFTIADSSKLLDGNNADQQSGTQTATFSIVAKPTPVITPVQTPVKTTSVVTPKETKTTASVATTPQKTVEIPNAPTSTQTAAVVTSGFGTNSGMIFWILELIGAVIMFGIGYYFGRRHSA
jgi:hypothetical protein